MVSNIEDFDFIVTKTEKEALVLEINLIKKYRPKYNIQFIDDSSYPYIKLTREKYPRLMIARDTKKDRKARYFGPFPDAGAARLTAKVLQSVYPFRRCNTMHDRVCLYYHLGQCLGPCEKDIDPAEYEAMAEKVTRFMNGDTAEIEGQLEEKMMAASEAMKFEEAGEYRDMLQSIRTVIDKQNIEKDNRGSHDVFAWYADKGYLAITGFLVRNGVLLNKEFRLKPLYSDAAEEFTSFLLQYYEEHPSARELVVPRELEISALQDVLEMPLFQPQKGYRMKLIEMCVENAKKQLELKFNVMETQQGKTDEAVDELSRFAGCPMNRVELFDNSHTSGQFTVAACVVYEDGQPVRKDYRLYRLHTANDDTASMREVVYRRYFRLVKESGHMPDGILVDGGWTQIEAARDIIDSLGLTETIKIMGLVKDDHHNTRALMDTDGNILDISKDSALFFLLTRMQDEVHRAAITYHRKLRSKAQTKSVLDDVEGVGPKRKKQLLKSFGSLTKLRQATVEEIAQVIPQKAAENVYRVLHDQPDTAEE